MKTIKILIGSAFLIVGSKFQAQTTKGDSKCRMVVTSAMLQTGMSNTLQSPSTLDDFKKIAPNSSILGQDFSAYTNRWGGQANSVQFFNAMVGISFKDKANNSLKSNPLLRLGISYYSGSGMSNGYGYELTKPYDTLISSQTGSSIYIDSVYSENVTMDYKYQQVRFDGSIIFRTKPEERWSLYGGVGFSFGASINSQTSISISSSATVSSEFQGPNGIINNNFVNETYRNKTNFGASVYLPLGIDFRIGKKREFWKQIHMFYELRPGVNTLSIPELGKMTSATLQQGLGIKIQW